MEAPISASVGAMGSLLGKLDEILATEHKDEIWKLREDLEVTRTLLLKLSKARDPPVTARYWMKDVRELSYDMEDCVDAETDWIDEKMSGFKTRVEEANERYLSYKLEDSVPICADVAIDYRLPTVDGRKAVVGLHAKGGPIERLCQSLSDQDAKLKVVSIVGVGGIGKTTLAEQLWHKLGGAFQCRAFVQTCKKPDMRSILRSILSQVRPHQPPGVTDVHKLTQDICEHLQDKSYFVIIDDLWATSVWEVLSRSFPEGNHGSRIITTTEAEDVALACCAYQPTYIFEMQHLSVQHSEELFTSALFGSRVKQLDECSHEIMRRCGGLPQAIVSIASILASNRGTETSENTGEQWNYLQNFVLNDLGADIPFEEILKQVLNLCYNSLPSCLQTCLLYLSLYSENYIIFKEDLTKQWIVEGFICASTKKQTMEVARSYFDKLVIMGLIRHIDVKNGDEVLSYAVHHMVHDFITFKSIEVNFITVMDYSQSTIQLSDKVRRLSLQFGSAAYANTPASTRLSQVRSLSFIGLVKCMPSISEFKLLRVLILNLWGDQGSTFDLTRISELFLLRYLQIICNVIVQLPDQMQGLEHMETLEINARPDWSLSHLRLGGGTNQPDATLYPSDSSSEPFDPVKTFELLPPICSLPKWIGQLNKLCTLKIVVRELLKDDISCLGGLPTLTILSLYVRQHTAEIIVFNTAQFAALEYFEFRCGVLSLAFQEGAMPNLQMLKLGFNAHKGEQYGHFLAGIEHLSNLKEVAGIIGVADGAEEPDWRAAESAFKDAIQLAGEVNVKRADWIEEEYSSPKNQHFIQEKHPSSEQPGNIKEESDEDIERNSDMKQKESISSDFTNVSLPNGVEPPRTSVLDLVHDNPNALHHLVCEGDAAGVRDLLAVAASKGNDNLIRSLLETQNTDGHTALHLACRRGSSELVEAIVAYQENVDILDKDEGPPIVFALAAGSPQCVRALIRRSANVNSTLREGLGPSLAHVCAHHGQPECMQELLMAGADPNAVDGEGESILHIAVAKRYTDCAIVILENGGCSSMSIPNSQNKTPLHLCIETWNATLVKRWLEVASEKEIFEAIDVPSPIGTALCMAAALKKEHEKEGRELVRILLAAGADPTAQDDPHCRTALHTAAMINDAELVKIILEAGVDVNIRNAQNTTPLHVALNRGANSCVGLLLAAGANCNLQDDDGDNSFHIAADASKMIRENLNWVVQMLQHPSPAVEVRNHRGWTLRDFLERLPREWISEELMETLEDKGVHLSPTIYEVADWVKFRRTVTSPDLGWQGAGPRSIGFVQSIVDNDHLIVSFCSGEARVLTSEVIKVIPLNRGQHVQLKPDILEPRFGWRGQSRDSIGTVLCVDDDGTLRVGFPGASRGWRADPAEIERVEEYKVGNWVRIRPSLTVAVHGMESITPGSVGVVYSIRPDSSLLLGLCYLSNPWLCEPEEVEHVDAFKIGHQVCVKRSIAEPRYGWGGETHHSVGKIIDIESDGLLIIDIPNRSAPWQADPSDMEKIDDFKVGDWVRVKATVPSPKYGWEDVTRNSIGIVHSLEEDGDMGVAFCFRSKLFLCSVADVEKAQPFEVGEKVHVLPSISQPRLGWSDETAATIGAISRIDMDGTLNVKVSGRKSLWKVAPGDAEKLSAFEVGDWVRLKPSIGMRRMASLDSYSPPTLEPNTANEDSSQAMVVGNADETGQGSPKKKRHKFDDGDGTSCKRCSCKKSKCLKLYCECFHAGVFCSEPCSCQGCLNKPSNMETVLATREQIESRNPLAFAPKVIRSSEPGHELLG